MSTDNILLRLRQRLTEFSPTLQKLGRFILDDVNSLLYLSITELAQKSKTSEASVIRLCRHLGCKGYTEFKMALAVDNQSREVPNSSEKTLSEQLIYESTLALRDTGTLLDEQAINNAADKLHSARQIVIYGVAASAIIGQYLHYKLLRLGKSSLIFVDMHCASMQAGTLNNQDVLIAVSSSGSTKDVIWVSELAQKQGAHLIIISNTQTSPLGQLADIKLVAAKPEGPLTAGLLATKIGGMFLVEILTAELSKRSPNYTKTFQTTAEATLSLLL